jgi:flagellar biosynthesis anti-sigma factor FlgM
MDIRNSLEGLRSLFGVNQAAPSAPQGKSNASAAQASAFGSDRATLSSAASEMAQTVSDEGVRTDKVAAVQSALAAGTYNVPALAVASKLVDAMMAGGQ